MDGEKMESFDDSIKSIAASLKAVGMNCPEDILSKWMLVRRIDERGLEDLVALIDMCKKRIDENKKEMIRSMSHIPQINLKTFSSFVTDRVTGEVSQMISHVMTLSFIDNGMNVVIIGDQGTGKTHIAQAIGNECCDRKINVRYFKMQEMKDKIKKAIDQEKTGLFVQSLVSLPCLIIDEIGFCTLTETESRIFFQVVDERYDKGRRSLVFTSNKKPSEWKNSFSDAMLAKCILDRIFDKCIRITMKGESYRGREQINFKLNFGSSTEINGLL